ncbi:MAG: metal ABC transporter ATP-binding protein [Clostridiales bacterium]|nr:metal ABC transporter ATP-binding protein [Clostridiales bacterium]
MKRNGINNNKDNIHNNDQCGFHCLQMQDIEITLGQNTIIEDINIHIHCGNLTTIIGRNGAGKSTLIKAIIGEIPYKGKMLFQDLRSNKMLDMNVGYVPQHINIEKNTPTSVYDLFASFISNKPVFLYKDKGLYKKIKESLALFNAENLIDKTVSDLSGGELQRVLLSIAINPIPNLLLLDEPISGGDRNGMELFYSNINYLKMYYDLAIIMVSHDFEFVRKYSDHVILLDRTIIKEGPPDEVLSSDEFENVFGKV